MCGPNEPMIELQYASDLCSNFSVDEAAVKLWDTATRLIDESYTKGATRKLNDDGIFTFPLGDCVISLAISTKKRVIFYIINDYFFKTPSLFTLRQENHVCSQILNGIAYAIFYSFQLPYTDCLATYFPSSSFTGAIMSVFVLPITVYKFSYQQYPIQFRYRFQLMIIIVPYAANARP